LRLPATIALLPLLAITGLPSLARADEPRAPIASAFVFPVGDELDFKKAAPGERSGYHVSDPYLAVRKARRHGPRRVHYGTDFSAGQGGLTVRAIANGVVDVSDANARVKVRTVRRVKVPAVVNGKRTTRTVTKYRTAWKWRSGWGNRVVIRHTLPDGQVVYSLYAHLMPQSVIVRSGDMVTAGQPIARVGRTGRASAPHLHLEIRTTRVEDREEIVSPSESESSDEEGDPGDRGEAESPHTVDPLAFLVDHVMKFDDLEPGSWQARYALAAVKDGVMDAEKGHFEPDDDVSRGEFYAALVGAFHLGTSFTKVEDFNSSVDALVDNGILDASVRSSLDSHDKVERSDALELVLRCLDKGLAHGQCMGRIQGDQLAHDFNVEFAGKDEAKAADLEAKKLAADEASARRKQAIAAYELRAKAARAKGALPPKRRIRIEPVLPVPILDPGFQSLAKSDKKLSRAEVCLLLASALRIGSSNVSALERAATRAAKTG
jgi:murein DD-endopeptidase MepM/ murein hydrolase activator NlpD